MNQEELKRWNKMRPVSTQPNPDWLLDWLEGRLRSEELSLEQRAYMRKRYKGELPMGEKPSAGEG